MAGNTPNDEDDPFAYLYRSEGRAPQMDQATQAMPPVPAEAGWSDTAATRQVGRPQAAGPPPGQWNQYGGYDQAQNGYADGYADGYGQQLPGQWQEAPPRRGGNGVSAKMVVLAVTGALLAAGLGAWAMTRGGEKATAQSGPLPTLENPASAPAQSAKPSSSAPAATELNTTADKLQLTGAAKLATDHKGYTGSGFVSGLDDPGSGLTWTVQAAAKGRYKLTVRYANARGSDLKQAERKIGLSVNGTPTGQLRMPVTGTWDSWGKTWRNIKLKQGSNQIVVSCGGEDSCHVNIDTLELSPQ